eukprot:m.81596 g.81596  ORF g.81596 m.81596 type:complete len:316 (-) comp14575_c0_seq3:22-969(-)
MVYNSAAVVMAVSLLLPYTTARQSASQLSFGPDNNLVDANLILTQDSATTNVTITIAFSTSVSIGGVQLAAMPLTRGSSLLECQKMTEPFTNCNQGSNCTLLLPALDNATAANTSTGSITLFGYNAVIGRTAVVYDANNTIVGCGTLGHDGQTDVLRQLADLGSVTDQVAGVVTLEPLSVDGSNETLVIASVYSPNGSATTGHKWHVHQLPVPDDGNCSATAGHFNPTHVNASSPTYSDVCGPADKQLGCEVGDLSSKSARIDLMSEAETKVRYLRWLRWLSMASVELPCPCCSPLHTANVSRCFPFTTVPFSPC